MQRQRSRKFRLIAAMLLATAMPVSPAFGQDGTNAAPPTYGDGLRRWSASDSVRLRYLTRHGDMFEPDAIALRVGEDAIWSLDRRRVLILTYNGDPDCDCLHYRLSVFDAGQIVEAIRSPGVGNAPGPIAQASFDSHSSILPGIAQPRWADSDSVTFIGVKDGFQQVFRLSATTGAITQLTDVTLPYDPNPRDGDPRPDFSGAGYDFVLRGNGLLFQAGQLVRVPPLVASYPSVSVADESLVNLHFRTQYMSTIFWKPLPGTEARTIMRCLGGEREALSLSPNGRWAVLLCQRIEGRNVEGADPASRFWLFDTGSGALRPLATRASRGPFQIAWRSDSTQVALMGVSAASDAGCAVENGEAPQILVMEPSAGSVSCISPAPPAGATGGRPTGIRWGGEGMIVSFRGATRTQRFERTYAPRGTGWRAGPDRPSSGEVPAAPAPSALAVGWRESANQPGSVVASLRGRTLDLLPPDPALQDVWRAPVREIEWREGDVTVRGGLLLPRDHPSGVRLPLVIQIGEYFPDMFLPDGGNASTIFAAQALVAQGFAVLNIDPRAQPEQGAHGIEEILGPRIDAIVETLSGQGLIDAARIGLVGFSHTGYQAHYLATHPRRTRLAAVIAADSANAGYGEYVNGEADSRGSFTARQYERTWGGSFWETRETWLGGAPLFNLQNITAPILFELHTSRQAMTFLAEPLGAYRLARKPFEYFLFPNGMHQLRRPLERIASMNNNVSWMAFWLQNREIPGLQSEETYARWRRMRELRDRNAQAAVPSTATPAPVAQRATSSD